MFEQNGLEAMMARLHSGSNVFFFRPSTILILRDRRARDCWFCTVCLSRLHSLSVFDGFSLLSGAGPRCWSPRATCKPGA